MRKKNNNIKSQSDGLDNLPDGITHFEDIAFERGKFDPVTVVLPAVF